MAWTQPLYSATEIAGAGRILASGEPPSREERELALAVTNNWRASHAFLLNTFQITLRRNATKIDPDATVSQRLKRLPSIVQKLRRLEWLSLDEMQDLGGCRAVLADVGDVQTLVELYRTHSSIRHRLVDFDHYINEPKKSGYRSVHLIYAYESDRSRVYNDLKIEMQLRTSLQHAWATAVETVGAFTSQALKSSAGERRWLRFFALASSAFAMREVTPLVPGTPTDWPSLIDELSTLAVELKILERLAGYSTAMQVIEDTKGARFVILELDTVQRVLRVKEHNNQLVAADAYSAAERAAADQPGLDVVLVRVESLDALRKAYPNYFADTSLFVDALSDAMARQR